MLTRRRSGRQWRVRPGTPSPLGQKIRQARLELGLTLAAVAGKDFSRAFLNQVELGRAHPSVRTLRIIAERLQRPIEYFLQDPEVSSAATELALTESQTRLHQGDAARAEALVRQLLDRQIPLEVQPRALLVLAGALQTRGAAHESIPVLEKALTIAAQAGRIPLNAELNDSMGRAFYLLRRPRDAERWFGRALEAYESDGLNDPVLKARILSHQANLSYVAGDPANAITAYEAAIAAAEKILDLTAVAKIYEGLALSFQQTGQYANALAYAQRSLRIFESRADIRMTAELRHNMAEMLLAQGRPREAEQLYVLGAADLERINDQQLLPLPLAGAAEAALEVGALDRADQFILRGLLAVKDSSDPLAKVAVHRVAGRVAYAHGRRAEAHEHFGKAVAVAETVASPELRARAAYDFARALEDDGDMAGAALRFRQAYEASRASSGGTSTLSNVSQTVSNT